MTLLIYYAILAHIGAHWLWWLVGIPVWLLHFVWHLLSRMP